MSDCFSRSPYNVTTAAEKHAQTFLSRAGLQDDPRPGLDLLKGIQIKADRDGPDGAVIRNPFDAILLKNVIAELEATYHG